MHKHLGLLSDAGSTNSANFLICHKITDVLIVAHRTEPSRNAKSVFWGFFFEPQSSDEFRECSLSDQFIPKNICSPLGAGVLLVHRAPRLELSLLEC